MIDDNVTKEVEHILESSKAQIGSKTYPKTLVAIATKYMEMKKAMEWFVERVDRGEVKSRRTYAHFKDVLQSDPLKPTKVPVTESDE